MYAYVGRIHSHCPHHCPVITPVSTCFDGMLATSVRQGNQPAAIIWQRLAHSFVLKEQENRF